MSQKPPMTLTLAWDGEQRFHGRVGDLSMTLDGRSHAGPSPMHALAFGLAGCMGIDVASILQKGRHPLQALDVMLVGQRAESPPARFVAFDLRYVVTGDIPVDAVERAVALSKEKYCSVWHSLRQDITLDVSYEVRPA
jgi:putative redox protein